MGFFHRHKLVEALTDPDSKQLSASRIASFGFFCLDIVWVFACLGRIPAAQAYGPVSSMLAICTGAAFTAYGVNSAGRTWGSSMGTAFASWRGGSVRVDNPDEPKAAPQK